MDLIAYWHKTFSPFLHAGFGRSERGAALVEYALLLTLITVFCIVALTAPGLRSQ